MLEKYTCMQRAGILIAVLLVLCGIGAYIGVNMSNGLVVPMEAEKLAELGEITVEQPEIVSCTRMENGLLLMPLRSGETVIISGDKLLANPQCRGNFIYDRFTSRYTGAVWVQIAVLVFLVGTLIILLMALRSQVRTAFYHYATPMLAGFTLLCALTLIILAATVFQARANTLETIISGMPTTLIFLMLPFLILFEAAMFASNLSLLRHEGKTWRNLLGSLIGLTLSMAILTILLNSNMSGSLEELRFHTFLLNLFSGIVLWTVCKLAGIILCGVLAAKHQPAMDKDYILILGCKLSRKGGLTPLLRGRVDRALGFARQQEAATGHMPVLIPCGGKGKDELRSEAEAMREYLLEQGVPENGILTEDRSANTWENIRNAQTMMEPDARTAYATTNYHVFRAGVWASRNGLKAEGMGSRTKWYYWPNAFMREYVALMKANLRHELIMLVLIGIQSGLLAYLYQ